MPDTVGRAMSNDGAAGRHLPSDAGAGPPLFSFVAPLFCYLGDDTAYAIGSNEDHPGIQALLGSIGAGVATPLSVRSLVDSLNAAAIPAGVDGLRNAGRVFVWHSRAETDVTEMRELAWSLLRYGPNLLLWIATADAEHPAGMVEYVKHGLLRGFVAGLGTESRDLASWQAMWQAACVAADFLRARGEWSYGSGRDQSIPGAGSVGLGAAATAIHEAESAGPSVDVGPVRLGRAGFPDARSRADLVHNAGIRTIRTAVLEPAILHAAGAVLFADRGKIKETQYGHTDAAFAGLEVDGYGLRFCHTDKTAIIGYNVSWDNYYHWFAQCLPAIAHSVRVAGADRCVLVVRALRPWQDESLRLLGLADMPRIEANVWKPYFFSKAIYCEFLGGHGGGYISPYLDRLMAALAKNIEVSDDRPRRLYVSRSDATRRPLTNERQVEDVLRSHGFAAVVPSTLSLVEQIRLFKGADVVVGPHGAGMTNIGFCRPGTKVLELMQSTFVRVFMTRIAQAARLDYRVACFESEDPEDMPRHGWSVDIGRLMDAVSEIIGPAV